MEVNGVEKVLVIPKSTGANLHGFDAAVDAFGGAVSCIQDTPEVPFDRFGHVLNGGKSTSHGPIVARLWSPKCDSHNSIVSGRFLCGPTPGSFRRTVLPHNIQQT